MHFPKDWRSKQVKTVWLEYASDSSYFQPPHNDFSRVFCNNRQYRSIQIFLGVHLFGCLFGAERNLSITSSFFIAFIVLFFTSLKKARITNRRPPATGYRPTDMSSTDSATTDPPTILEQTHRPPTHQQVFDRPTDHRPSDSSSTNPSNRTLMQNIKTGPNVPVLLWNN